MSIREAIEYAADRIERHASEYNFLSTARPTPCGTPGCALGWIGYYLGVNEPTDGEPKTFLSLVENRLGVSCAEFYDRMDAYHPDRSQYGRGTWTTNAQRCAYALRMYAVEFHRE